MTEITRPNSFAVNVINNKQSVALQKKAFNFGYKWNNDFYSYNQIDIEIFYNYGKQTCLIFDVDQRTILFCKIADLKHYPGTLFFKFTDTNDIDSLFQSHSSYWEEQDMDTLLQQSELKERIIL